MHQIFSTILTTRRWRIWSALPEVGLATLITGVIGDMEYRRIWDAGLGPEQSTLMTLLSSRDERLRLEARLASEAGFAEHEVIVEPIISSAERALPPLIGANGQDEASMSPTYSQQCG